MSDLAPGDFATYFEAIHQQRPFPWQERLLAHVVREGRWPSLLDLPTGAGKTAAIDVAVFHLALDAGRPPTERRAPRRIVMVVDRRTVVDQAFERAEKVAAALNGARGGVLAAVRERLCALSGTDEPLARAQLRGGMPRDDAWARRPDQPLVAVSTVDQVGSRLLFRGYGVSDAMRPIHAGLLGHDTLFLLDEVHLSQPFLETLEAIRRYRTWGTNQLPDRWQFVAMSATPGTAGVSFGLGEEDQKDERLARRLRAAKPIEHAAVAVAGSESAKRTKFAEECAKRVDALAAPGRAVAVVVNRVATALEVFRLVKSCRSEGVFLVTGRMRPLDRNEADKSISELVRSGRSRDATATPIVVVATQCIEAGADFDFDALVTECASLDALRQRFGRLNRLGAIADARGVVLVRSDALGKDEPDFVYGHALEATWRWIEQAPRDFGIQAMAASLPRGDELTKMLPPLSRAPVMLPAHLDAWTQTTPVPRPDPDVSLWLHGVDQKPEADVQVVWRADLGAELIARAVRRRDASAEEDGTATERALAALLARMDACPPTGLEALAVPIGAARAWLAGSAALDVADVEGRSAVEEERVCGEDGASRSALLWKGDDSVVVRADDLRPGMTLVVPSTYGGLAHGTWDPTSKTPVTDLGDRGRWEQTRRPTLRLHHALMAPGWPALPLPSTDDDEDVDENERVSKWLGEMESAAVPGWLVEVVRAMRGARRPPVIVRVEAVEFDEGSHSEPGYLALVGRTRVRNDGVDVSTEDDGASYTGVEVTLDEHMKGVKSWAGRFAAHCGLPPEIVGDLEIAARWHDAGKVDPRFQRMLRGGSPLSDVASKPLAKSRIVAADRATRVRARERSGYPRGARHELSSVSLLTAEVSLLAEAADKDLVLHLVASHHGWCRPFAPVIEDREPVDLILDTDGVRVRVSSEHGLASLDSGVPERFWLLVERYGWFGLAWIEAILRLADHRRSEEEQTRAFAGKEST
jgi:CRISPR-associated endonuclease/helicase Cas3